MKPQPNAHFYPLTDLHTYLVHLLPIFPEREKNLPTLQLSSAHLTQPLISDSKQCQLFPEIQGITGYSEFEGPTRVIQFSSSEWLIQGSNPGSRHC